ncbi:Conjugative transposon protein TcpC [Gemella morbillorum]|uniref:conjugal transfer protein n=1 Tax=Gemella morbillorum TaxID=29391 RepID=UPI000DA3BB4C|nr:conjugal transfer protein [Gemella morbillorum]UBH80469.1 conjugal transfer protein [Gemella morbillorum]SQH55867.1 Conjugative transposon protein TcpC [Gemella morbillorum]
MASLEKLQKKIEKQQEKQRIKLEKQALKQAKKQEKILAKQRKKQEPNKIMSTAKDVVIGENKEYIKQEEFTRKLEVNKRKNKFIVFTVWFIVFSILSSSIFLIATKGMDKIKLSNNINAIEKIENQIQGIPIYNARTDNFAKNFATLYINYDREKQQERKKALELLSLENLKDNIADTSDVERSLNSIRLYTVEDKEKDVQVYKYIVSYTLKNKDNKKNKQEILNVPVKIIDNNYLVCDFPYFSDIPKDTATGSYQEKEVKLETEKDKRQELESFTKDFFKKYTTYKKEEMQYIMKNPESLSGKEFNTLENFEVYKDNDKYLVITTVVIQEKDFKLSTREKFKLTIIVKDDKYFVEKLEHN